MPEIDAMSAVDWGRVREIYLEGIATGNATFETAAPSWEKWNASHRPDCRFELHRRAGFRAIGTREKLGCMDGRWRDVVLMERRSAVAGQ